jgi:hypothetical protein
MPLILLSENYSHDPAHACAALRMVALHERAPLHRDVNSISAVVIFCVAFAGSVGL